ncbi:MAG TPA: PEP-utilizing enzyme [Candidatus Dormibacteraeota bacterium]|nr:PEP-utilizing enzyme [Candidatus Dormibacteraeota bacterium]
MSTRSAAPATPSIEPPGPGRWTRDAARYPRPVTPTLSALLPRAAARGFHAATRPYGLLLDHIEWGFVDGWAYMGPRRIPPLRDAQIRDRRSWDALVEGSPELRRRLRASGRVFERRVWRSELAQWRGVDRPARAAANAAIASVDPEALDDPELDQALRSACANVAEAIRIHHLYDATPAVAVGDLLVHVEQWTGSPAVEHLDLLGRGPRSVLGADELAALADAVRSDPAAARAIPDGIDGTEVIPALQALGGDMAGAVAAVLDAVGWWCAASTCDVDEPSAVEVPGLLGDALRAAVTRASEGSEAAHDRASEVRAAVPVWRRQEFDAMLADARAVHRLRDERALYADVWAVGLLRRAILAAGRRLADRGALRDPADALEATPRELRALLAGRGAPLAGVLTARGHRRRTAVDDVPGELGDPPWPPIPVEWLPEGSARTERAFRAFLSAMDEGARPAEPGTVRGLPASPGVHVGRARLVDGGAALGRVEAGDVLVAAAASPSLVVVFPLVGAIVTDHGGMLSHAAIVAREQGVPAVVGTGDATRLVRDGARVRVDGGAGVVTLLDR